MGLWDRAVGVSGPYDDLGYGAANFTPHDKGYVGQILSNMCHLSYYGHELGCARPLATASGDLLGLVQTTPLGADAKLASKKVLEAISGENAFVKMYLKNLDGIAGSVKDMMPVKAWSPLSCSAHLLDLGFDGVLQVMEPPTLSDSLPYEVTIDNMR